VLGALFYLQWHSVYNRTLMRLKRLRQPKYFLFALVGGFYFYFYFFRQVFGMRSFRGAAPMTLSAASGDTLVFYELIAALIFFVLVLLAWIIPHQRAALLFTEAEIAFLFPAPISRRGLIHFKLLRSQFSILITTLFFGLLRRRFAGHFWLGVAGWWLVLSTLSLHFMGSSFARTMLLDRGVSNWKRRSAAGLIVAAVITLVIWWARKTVPPIGSSPLENLDEFQRYLRQALTSGPALYLLYPFRLIVRPFLAPNARSFLLAFGPALGLMVLHYWWVVRSDVAFEEASIEASQKLATKVAAIRSGNWQAARKPVKAKKPPFRLRPLGPQPIALLWKNLISAGQAFTLRMWIIFVIIGLSMCIGISAGTAQSGWRAILAMLSGMFIIWTLLLGPQFVRQDLRHDLPRADMLKM
jgi:ABC-2 type transport system permease protein